MIDSLKSKTQLGNLIHQTVFTNNVAIFGKIRSMINFVNMQHRGKPVEVKINNTSIFSYSIMLVQRLDKSTLNA